MSAGFENDMNGQGRWQSRGCSGGMRWKPVEILAVVLGFATYWPIGLAILGWKIAQRRGYPVPGIFAAARDGVSKLSGAFRSAPGPKWRPFGESTSGNAAFDEWRKTELEKLEDEHRKLAAAEREFAEHMENLRHARDREEFDRFMANRRGHNQG